LTLIAADVVHAVALTIQTRAVLVAVDKSALISLTLATAHFAQSGVPANTQVRFY